MKLVKFVMLVGSLVMSSVSYAGPENKKPQAFYEKVYWTITSFTDNACRMPNCKKITVERPRVPLFLKKIATMEHATSEMYYTPAHGTGVTNIGFRPDWRGPLLVGAIVAVVKYRKQLKAGAQRLGNWGLQKLGRTP